LIASQYAFLNAREDKFVEPGKTKIIERVEVVEADVDDSTPKDIEKLEQEIKNKTEK